MRKLNNPNLFQNAYPEIEITSLKIEVTSV